MQIERVEKISQLDKILPMMQEVHSNSNVYRGKSFAAYIYYCGFNLMFPNQFTILVFKDDEIIKGYAIANIGSNQFENHCTIVDAYMTDIDEEATKLANEMLEAWAEENGCIFMETLSNRVGAVYRKYGYEPISEYLRKPIGGVK